MTKSYYFPKFDGYSSVVEMYDDDAFIDNISAPAPAGLPVNCLFDDYLEDIFHEEDTGLVRNGLYINRSHEVWRAANKKVLDGPLAQKAIRDTRYPKYKDGLMPKKDRQNLPPIVGGRKKKEAPPRYRFSEGTSSSA
jgi:hypothetical protein|tara:strand:- start:816 stop:1226 length:411 start_codon:yes stop_codon:yes gene_type:complete